MIKIVKMNKYIFFKVLVNNFRSSKKSSTLILVSGSNLDIVGTYSFARPSIKKKIINFFY